MRLSFTTLKEQGRDQVEDLLINDMIITEELQIELRDYEGNVEGSYRWIRYWK